MKTTAKQLQHKEQDMGNGYITLILIFLLSQLVTVGTVVLLVRYLVRELNRQRVRADRLSSEIFEQYRRNFSENDKTADTTVSTLNNTNERSK